MKQSSKQQFNFKKYKGNRHLRTNGFVLVAVLLIIALAVVLVVTTSSVSQTERKAVSNSANQEIARQNALFALNLAVSQLQVAAGPDQRVTATADILNSNSAIPSPVAQPYWTGIWKSFNPTWTNNASPWFRPQPLDTDTNGNAGTTATALRPWSGGGGTNAATNPNVTWLVSGATNNTFISPLLSTTNWMTNSIVLASNWGTGTNGSMTGAIWTNSTTVTVPLVSLTNGTTNIGKYAYWVSDEGVKAKVSLKDTNMTSGSISSVASWIPSLLHYFAPPAMNVSSVMTNFGITTVLTTDFRSNTNLIKVTGLGGLAFITNSVPAFTNNTLAADLTPHSYGVLSDTRNGGLRQDLTAAFESSISNGTTNWTTLQARSGSGTGNDACCVYRATNTAIAPINTLTNFSNPYPSGYTVWSNQATVFDGLRWISLYSYYNLYKSAMPTNAAVGAAVGNNTPSGIGGSHNSGVSPISAGYNTLEARYMGWWETNTAGPSANRFSAFAIAPTQIADRIDTAITAYSYLTNIGTNNVKMYSFKVLYYPMLTMYNPYATALTFTNTLNYTISKNCMNSAQVIVQCGTNIYTNITGSITNANTNLFPADTNNDPYLFQPRGGYPMSQTVTNITTMLPGEIRVFAIPAISNVTTMSAGPAFPNLVSQNANFDAYQSYPFPWPGTTNPLDPVTTIGFKQVVTTTNGGVTNYTTNTVTSVGVSGYNESRWYPNALNNWPGSGQYGFSAATPCVLQPSGSGSAAMVSWSAPTIGSWADNAITYRLAGCIERLKGVYAGSETNFANSTNMAPMMMGNSTMFNAGRYWGGSALGGGGNGITTEVYATARDLITPLNDIFTTTLATNLSTKWGALSAGSTNNSSGIVNPSRLVLRDIPVTPMTSLGQFQHLEDFYTSVSQYKNFCFPAMSIGGGFAGPDLITNNATFAYNANAAWVANNAAYALYFDYSHLVNEALFDTYFFSTIPPATGFDWGSGGYGAFSNNALTTAAIASNQPLPNSRYVYYRKNGSNPAVADLQDESKAAANLLIDGAFNVNSTSVMAWKALLGSLQGSTFHTYNYNTGNSQDYTPVPGAYPIPRFWSVSYSSSQNVPWEGLRTLNDTQLTALATEIVKQVRLRGPFLSMGDFLNRRLGSYIAQTNALGTLQAAIENTATNGTAADVNYCIRSIFNQVPNVSGMTALPKIVGNTAAGIPGYLTQSDIMQAFSPVMTARSDTFVIRVYGESDKPSTNSSTTTYSQAWGEAVVQRLPEFFDQTDPALTSTAVIPGISYALSDGVPLRNSSGLLVSSVNQSFGRRFKIVSFRWLSQNEL